MTMLVTRTATETMNGYLQTLQARGAYVEYFTPDIVVENVLEGQRMVGREAAEAFIRGAHEQAFDAEPQLVSLIVEGDHAAAELLFVGRHTGEFAGIAPTGKQVRVPYTAFYDLEGDHIKALRLYGLAAGLMHQLE